MASPFQNLACRFNSQTTLPVWRTPFRSTQPGGLPKRFGRAQEPIIRKLALVPEYGVDSFLEDRFHRRQVGLSCYGPFHYELRNLVISQSKDVPAHIVSVLT